MQASNTHKYLTLVFDQGSHASRIALFSETGQLVYLKSADISTCSPESGHYEHDANEILNSLLQLLNSIPGRFIKQIINCSLCTQRSSVVAWHKQSGTPLSPVISWRDLRNVDFLNRIKTLPVNFQKITGLPLSGHYSASKIHWLLHNNAKVKQAANDQQLCVAPLSSFLTFHLLDNQPFIVDHSNAQRSLLFDIKKLIWSDELLDVFQISRDFLPDCLPVISHHGVLKNFNIPMTAVCGDQNAAVHAYPEMTNDKALINIGTGAFVLSKSDELNKPAKLLRSIISSNTQHANYLTEGTVNGAGNAISWATNMFSSIALYNNENKVFSLLPEWINTYMSPPVFINTVSGLGSPWWCNGGSTEFINNTEASYAEKYVAIIESIVFLLFSNMQQLKHPPKIIFISGGLARIDGLCQKLADLAEAEIQRFQETETSARGCAWLANQLNTQEDKEHPPLWQSPKTEKHFSPENNPELLRRYQQLVGELQKRCHSD